MISSSPSTTRALASRQAAVLTAFAECVDSPSFEQALDALTGVLREQFKAVRVVIAITDHRGNLQLRSISQQALVSIAAAESQLLVEVLQEACDLERPVYLSDDEDRLGILAAHRALSNHGGKLELASVPLFHAEQQQGAILIERGDCSPFDESTRQLLEQIALSVTPLLVLRREAARGIVQHVRSSMSKGLSRLFGAQRPGLRLALLVSSVACAMAVFVPVNRSVVANAELVPIERRLVTAPVDGFVQEVSIAAGQRVTKGQVLARLDRRELDLELASRQVEITSARSELRAAMASHDRQATAIARAQLNSEQALNELIEQRIGRSVLRSPIAGLVISGDPSQVSGLPVARGDTLFEVAPEDGFEVHLLVHEADVKDIYEGQIGAIAMSSQPGEAIAVTVSTVHPVAETLDGASRFRVRATIDEQTTIVLRPGQLGVARLQAGKSTLAKRLLNPVFRRIALWRWRFLG